MTKRSTFRDANFMFVVVIGIAGCGGGRDSASTTVPREGNPEDRFEVVITRPEADAEILIGEPIPCVVEVTNLTGGGAPRAMALSIKHGRSTHASTFPQLVDYEYPPGGPYRFEGALRVRDLVNPAPEGTYIVRAQAVSVWYEEPIGEQEKRQSKQAVFESEGVPVTVKRQ